MRTTFQQTSHHTSNSYLSTYNGSSSSKSIIKQRSPNKYIGKQIQAQSSSSIDIKEKDNQELMMRILMMSMEIQRKDVVVKNLLKQLELTSSRISLTKNQQSHKLQKQLANSNRLISDLQFKCSQYELKIQSIQSSFKLFSRQSEQRISEIQTKNKQLQIIKIQSQSSNQKLITQIKMISYKLMNVQNQQKGKFKQMQNQIHQSYQKVQQQRKINQQFHILIQTKCQQLKQIQQRFKNQKKQYEQTIRTLEREIHHKQDLKKSQIHFEQQKVSMTQSQLIRIQQELKGFRKKISDLEAIIQLKQQELLNQLKRYKQLQYQSSQTTQHVINLQRDISRKSHQCQSLFEQLSLLKCKYKDLQQANNEESNKSSTTHHQLVIFKQECESQRLKISSYLSQIQQLRAQVRKLKRKPHPSGSQCNTCKITTQKSIKYSQISMNQQNSINLSEIIEQTEKLHRSSQRVESILAKRQVGFSTYGQGQSRISEHEYSNHKSYIFTQRQ